MYDPINGAADHHRIVVPKTNKTCSVGNNSSCPEIAQGNGITDRKRLSYKNDFITVRSFVKLMTLVCQRGNFS